MQTSKSDNLKSILEDNTSGSTELVLKLNEYFKTIINDKIKINESIKLSRKHFQSFEIINNYLNQIVKFLNQKDDKKLKEFINNFNDDILNKYKSIYKNAKEHFSNIKKVLTLSNSFTIQEVFKLWHKENKNLYVIVAESRPKKEGIILANKLLKENIKVEFITDALIPFSIKNVDAVIIGSDRILKNKNVINKTGSLSAALSAKYYNKPFYVISTKNKITKSTEFEPEKKSYKEVLENKKSKLKVTNIYFEEIQNELITKIITD